MNPWEQTGWVIVDAGRMTQAQISQVTIAKAVMPPEKNVSLANSLATLSNTPPVKKYNLMEKAPGSMIWANRKKSTA